MRITFVLPGFGRRPSGGLKVAYQYANALVAMGHDVTLVNQVPDDSFFHLKSHAAYLVGKAYQVLHDKPYVPWFSFDPRIHATTVRRISDRALPAADVTILTGWPTAVRTSPRAFHAGVFTQIVYDFEFWMSDAEMRPKISAALARSDVQHIATSGVVADMLSEIGVTPVAVIPAGIDPAEFGLDESIASRPRVLSFCLRPEAHKDVATALRAITKIVAVRPEVIVECFGRWDGVELPAGVRSLGQISRAELRALYNRTRIFIFSSQYEGYGLPAAEAMACGAAVVSTRSGGVEDFIHDHETGLLVPVGDDSAVANAVVGLLEDDESRLRLATAGVELASTLTVEQSSKQLESLLVTLVASGGQRSVHRD